MNRKIFVVLLWALAGCSPLAELERSQSNSARLLEQQAIRMEMQEEYLAQLTEIQQELSDLTARIDWRLQQATARAPQPVDDDDSEADEGGEAVQTDAGPAQPEVVSPLHTKQVVGRNEWVWLELLSRNLKARVDTGAMSSSLSAIDILPFERDGRQWVRFRVPDEDHPEGGDTYETPLVKYVKIRQASSETMDRRPVVRLTVRLGDFVEDVEFNLSNRENMLYPVLLGRNFLRDVALVDVAQKFTQPKFQPDDGSESASSKEGTPAQ